MITDNEKMDNIARMVMHFNRIRKRDIFLWTTKRKVLYPRWQFYYLAFNEGFAMWEIARYCERMGLDVELPSIAYGIKRMKAYEKKLLDSGRFNNVRNISPKDRVLRRNLLKIQKRNGIDPFQRPIPRLDRYEG